MRANIANMVWGLALIIAGVLFLAQNYGLMETISPQVWVYFFAFLSIIFFASYFYSGISMWGWLFPACISGGLALTMQLGLSGTSGSYVAAPILFGVAIPFGVTYLLKPRERWWALIPTWVLSSIAVVVLIADSARGEVIGSLVLFSIALPFLMVYLMNRTRVWALIPGGILAIISLFPLLSTGMEGTLLGAIILFLIALPFFITYAWSLRNWWALIPAGFFATLSLVTLLAGGTETDLARSSLITGAMFGGWSLTFLVLWLRRGKMERVAQLDWARYPTFALASLAVIALFVGAASLRFVWPLLIVALGLLLLISSLRTGKRSV